MADNAGAGGRLPYVSEPCFCCRSGLNNNVSLLFVLKEVCVFFLRSSSVCLYGMEETPLKDAPESKCINCVEICIGEYKGKMKQGMMSRDMLFGVKEEFIRVTVTWETGPYEGILADPVVMGWVAATEKQQVGDVIDRTQDTERDSESWKTAK